MTQEIKDVARIGILAGGEYSAYIKTDDELHIPHVHIWDNATKRRGSGVKKIVNAYKQYEQMPTYRAPEFMSDATGFHVILWNLNYGNEAVKDGIDVINESEQFPKEFTNEFPKEEKQFPKEEKRFPKEFRKEFLSAQHGIYKLISSNPHITIVGMAEKLGVSADAKRQIRHFWNTGKPCLASENKDTKIMRYEVRFPQFAPKTPFCLLRLRYFLKFWCMFVTRRQICNKGFGG